MALMRLTADGMLDPLFDGDGMIAVDFDGNHDEANAVAIQPDGAIVAAGCSAGSGRSDAALLRVNGDGSLDSTFGDGGKSVIDLGGLGSVLHSIVVRADNSLAATGSRQNSESFDNDMIVARFLSNGTLDLTYAVEGVATADFGIGNHRSRLVGRRTHTAGRREISRCGSVGGRNSFRRPIRRWRHISRHR